MGGQFWPPELEEEDMPEVGAKYPMMLYDGPRQVIVYDDEEYEEALTHGFAEHPSEPQGTSPPGGTEPPTGEEKPPAKFPPQVRDVPYLSQTGDLLMCTMGNWTGEPDTYNYQFRRDTDTLVGTGSNEYVVTSADVGRSLDCVVKASNAAGEGSSTSNAVIVVEPGQPDQGPAQQPGQAPVPQRATVSVQKTVTVTPPPRPTPTPMSSTQAQAAAATAPGPSKPPAPKPPVPPPPATRVVPPPVSAAKPVPPKAPVPPVKK